MCSSVMQISRPISIKFVSLNWTTFWITLLRGGKAYFLLSYFWTRLNSRLPVSVCFFFVKLFASVVFRCVCGAPTHCKYPKQDFVNRGRDQDFKIINSWFSFVLLSDLCVCVCVCVCVTFVRPSSFQFFLWPRTFFFFVSDTWILHTHISLCLLSSFSLFPLSVCVLPISFPHTHTHTQEVHFRFLRSSTRSIRRHSCGARCPLRKGERERERESDSRTRWGEALLG